MFYDHIGQTCRLDGKWSLSWVTSQQSAGLEEAHTLKLSSFGLLYSSLQTFSPWAWQSYGCKPNSIHFQTLLSALLTQCPFNSIISLKTVTKQPRSAALFCVRTIWVEHGAEMFMLAVLTDGEISRSSHPAPALWALLLSEHGWYLQPELEQHVGTNLGCSAPRSLGQGTHKWAGHTHKEALRLQGCCVKNTNRGIQSFMLCIKQAISLLTESEDATK